MRMSLKSAELNHFPRLPLQAAEFNNRLDAEMRDGHDRRSDFPQTLALVGHLIKKTLYKQIRRITDWQLTPENKTVTLSAVGKHYQSVTDKGFICQGNLSIFFG